MTVTEAPSPAKPEAPCERPLRQITNDADCGPLEEAPRFAMDLEADAFHRYTPRVCLIQISTEDTDWIFDPLAGPMPERLAKRLADPTREVLLHGGDFDVRALKQDFGLSLGKLLDSSVAARILGLSTLGLKGLLEAELGVIIDKGEQRSNWGLRPLTDTQIAYARQDTCHLLKLMAGLEAKLEAVGRLSWFMEECERIREVEPSPKVFDPESWRRIKGSARLGPLGRQLLAGLYRWREEEAKEAEIPPFRVLPSDRLLRYARDLEADPSFDLKAIFTKSGLSKQLTGPLADRFLLTVQAAPKCPDPGPKAKKKPRKQPRHSPEALQFRDALCSARQSWAEKAGLDAGFMLSKATLDRIVGQAPSSLNALAKVEGMTRWRAELFGAELLSMATAGKASEVRPSAAH